MRGSTVHFSRTFPPFHMYDESWVPVAIVVTDHTQLLYPEPQRIVYPTASRGVF
jgi:hypothetical protein